MEAYSDIFDRFAREYVDKFQSLNGDWDKLTADEQEIVALWSFGADMFMDGFLSFFLAYGYDVYVIAMRGIERVGCKKLYKLTEKTYKKVLDRFQNDERIKAYGDIPQYLTERDEEILDELFEKFDEEYGEQLCEAAYKFYNSTNS